MGIKIKMKSDNWEAYFMDMARLVASKSKDESTKVGCVLVSQNNTVISTGYNGFPRGVNEDAYPERNERPEKYFWTEHAEANAVYNAALNGVKTNYAVAFSTYPPCVKCARALIQSGITTLYFPHVYTSLFDKEVDRKDWEAECAKALEILDAAGVKVRDAV